MSKRTAIVLVAIGIALRAWQYTADQSLWFDELSIARNVIGRSLIDLVREPLAYQQIAPIGYLVLVKLSTLLFGPSDLALRLPAFLGGITALVLFWRLAPDNPIAVGLFAISIPLIRYSAEVKQYSLDVVAALILTLIALDLARREPSVRRCVAAGLAGLVIVWFSQTAVFVMAGLGAALVLLRARRAALVTIPIWAAASVAAMIVSIHHVPPETMAFMHRFWTSRTAFFPTSPKPSDALWVWDRVAQVFGRAFSWYVWPGLFAGATFVGFVRLWRERRDVAMLVLGPVLVTLLAAVAQQYPFLNRTILFLMPAMLLAVGAAVEWVRSRTSWVVVLPFAVIPVVALVRMPPPYFYEGFKPVLAYVQSHRRPGDAVYVYANAYEAVDHYGPRYGLPAGSYVVGMCDERETRPFLEQVDRFRGAPRLWVIGSSVPEFQYPRDAIARYLGTIGIRRDSIAIRSPITPAFGPVSAELYDVSDTLRLRASSAATFLMPPNTTHRFPICLDFIRPDQNVETPSVPMSSTRIVS
jgi:hypothetical protein